MRREAKAVGISLAEFVRRAARKALVWQDAEKPSGYVILSGAKDLLLLVLNETQQMLRCAQHDGALLSAAC